VDIFEKNNSTHWKIKYHKIRPTASVAPEIVQMDAMYRQAFAQEKINQSERFDDLAKVLFAIQLAALTAECSPTDYPRIL
jgi:hypothetical protein